MIGWRSDTGDSANFYEFLVMCPDRETNKGNYNSGNYCNPEVDELVEASMIETDPNKRTMMLQKIEAILFEEAAFVPLYWENKSAAFKKDVQQARHGVCLYTTGHIYSG